MVKSYCVKQKKQTECVEPSGYKQAKNGRLMFYCTCSECGITKYKFVKSNTTGGKVTSSTLIKEKPYCGINKIKKGTRPGSVSECFNKNQLRMYGLNEVNKEVLRNLIQDKKKNQKEIKEQKELEKLIKKATKTTKQGN